VDAQPAARLAVRQPPAVEERLEAVGEILRERSALGVVREPPEREHGPIGRRDDVCAEPGTPDLDELRVLQRRRPGLLDPRVDGQERSAGHAVLETGPRSAEGGRLGRESLVERAGLASEGEDLRARKGEAGRRHGPSVACRRARRRSDGGVRCSG
jgi:hypothetical protein